jgi:hypothetical protein
MRVMIVAAVVVGLALAFLFALLPAVSLAVVSSRRSLRRGPRGGAPRLPLPALPLLLLGLLRRARARAFFFFLFLPF